MGRRQCVYVRDDLAHNVRNISDYNSAESYERNKLDPPASTPVLRVGEFHR